MQPATHQNKAEIAKNIERSCAGIGPFIMGFHADTSTMRFI